MKFVSINNLIILCLFMRITNIRNISMSLNWFVLFVAFRLSTRIFRPIQMEVMKKKSFVRL